MLLLEPLHFLAQVLLLLGRELSVLALVLHHRQLPLHTLVYVPFALLQLTHLHLAHIDLRQYQIPGDLGVDPLDRFGVAVHLRGGQLARLRYLPHFIIPQTNHHILWLEIGVDDMAHPVHVVQPDQALPRHLSDQRQRHPLVVISLNNFQKVDSKDLEDHDEVFAVGSVVDEGVEELSTVGGVSTDTVLLDVGAQLGIILVVLLNRFFPLLGLPVDGDLVQDLHLVVGCL
mmetsp:Transcript_17712/g.16946  ORF Transcript_17712/g.16946 Transcript_17712/m.16946 type:complete len:230 (+) Transcript_17712:639-1328(+)